MNQPMTVVNKSGDAGVHRVLMREAKFKPVPKVLASPIATAAAPAKKQP